MPTHGFILLPFTIYMPPAFAAAGEVLFTTLILLIFAYTDIFKENGNYGYISKVGRADF